MPAPSDFGDGSTVIEGATPSHCRGKRVETFSPAKPSGHYRDVTTFAKTTDYFSEERPFVVVVGKDGVIGALRQLDGHLCNVCMNFFFTLPLTFTLVFR